jgi:hypothetical protein
LDGDDRIEMEIEQLFDIDHLVHLESEVCGIIAPPNPNFPQCNRFYDSTGRGGVKGSAYQKHEWGIKKEN